LRQGTHADCTHRLLDPLVSPCWASPSSGWVAAAPRAIAARVCDERWERTHARSGVRDFKFLSCYVRGWRFRNQVSHCSSVTAGVLGLGRCDVRLALLRINAPALALRSEKPSNDQARQRWRRKDPGLHDGQGGAVGSSSLRTNCSGSIPDGPR
jgi:hypothetical protein